MIGEKFDIRDMGKLRHSLGVKITYFDSGTIWIGQPTYKRKLLSKLSMEKSKAVATPVESGCKLVKSQETDCVVDQEL